MDICNHHSSCCFIGHRDIWKLDVVEKRLKEEVIRLIENGVDTFYNGGMGNFDGMCSHSVYDLKQQFPHIRSYLVIPYLTADTYGRERYDEVIYPSLEGYHFKAAITKRNRWMVEQSGYAVCYVSYEWGGAYKTYTYAKRRGLKIINLALENK